MAVIVELNYFWTILPSKFGFTSNGICILWIYDRLLLLIQAPKVIILGSYILSKMFGGVNLNDVVEQVLLLVLIISLDELLGLGDGGGGSLLLLLFLLLQLAHVDETPSDLAVEVAPHLGLVHLDGESNGHVVHGGHLYLQVAVVQNVGLNGVSPGDELEVDDHEQALGFEVVEAVELLQHVELLLDLEVLLEVGPPVLLVPDAVIVEGLVDQLLEILLPGELLVEPLVHDAVELPLGLLLSQGLPPHLLVDRLLLQPLLLLLGHLDLLDFGPLLGPDSLELDRGALVLHFGHGEFDVEVAVELLLDVVEGQLHHDLSEGRVFLRVLDGVGVPDEVVDLYGVPLLVRVLSHVAETQGNSEALLGGAQFGGILLGDGLLFEGLHELVVSEIEEDLGLVLQVSRLDHEARLRLHDCASLLVNDWLATGVLESFLHRLKLFGHLALGNLLVHLHELLVAELLQARRQLPPLYI
mmetsp:Transcript_18266/g.31247  ORF Transcript_18266/g.31247 Transcript_18266/m.31247 type:complete len:470 (+) Transcript_18266:139-1548(+)